MTYIAVRVVNLSCSRRAIVLAVNDLRDSRTRSFAGRSARRLRRRKAAAALHNCVL